MHHQVFLACVLAGSLLGLGAPAPARDPAAAPVTESALSGPSQTLLRSLEAPLREIVAEVLARDPEIARAERLAVAASVRAPQARALPDPVAALSLFLLPAETRVGPQRFSASIQQKFPGFGKLALAERAALYEAAAAAAEVERIRLDKLTEARRIAHELAFLEIQEAITRSERGALSRYESAAQARYAAGTGLQQEIVRIQAQITRIDTGLLEITERRHARLAALNALRDRPAATALGDGGAFATSWPLEPVFDGEALRRTAAAHRPELAGADALIAAFEARMTLAEKNFRPDFTLGLSYTAVGRRNDEPGRLVPPPDNGDDILALSGAVNLPVRRRKLEAAVEEARARRQAAEEEKRRIKTRIESSIGDLVARIPLLARHLRLLDSVLLKQAREALRSAEAAYRNGQLSAVDLLDAEVVLFEVRIAAARTRTDLAVARAELERAVAAPVVLMMEDRSDER